MLDINHESYQAPPDDGHEGPIWDHRDVHVRGSKRAERVRPNVFWDKYESGRAHSTGLSPDDGDDV